MKKYFTASSLASVIASGLFGLVFWLGTHGDEPWTIVAISIIFGIAFETFLVTKDIPNNSVLLHGIDSAIQKTDKLIKNMVSDRERVSEIRAHLYSREPLVQDVGFKIWTDYLNRFRLNETGFFLDGEELALDSYVTIWRHLAESQRLRQQNGAKPMIARITHSNDVTIWLPDEQPMCNEFYTFQKRFIDHDGIIVRMLIGDKPEPSERYQTAMHEMEKIGIEVKYFYVGEVPEKNYDFLYLHDEHLTLKWYSGQSGKRLTGFFISDKVEEDVINRWITLFYKAAEKGKPVLKIPEDREFYYEPKERLGQ